MKATPEQRTEDGETMGDYNFEQLGAVIRWPNGYAMTLATTRGGWSVRCCAGHISPQGARDHGLVRLGEVAGDRADRDIRAWAERARDGAL